MIRQTAFLPRYGWRIEFFIDFTCEHAEKVLDAIEQIGGDDYYLFKAASNLNSCEKNSGLTYSSPDYRTSVAVVYRTDNFKEFINTLSHECAHICAHVTKSFLIKLNEEEFCEMVGDLMAQTSDAILRVSRQFIKG